MWQLTIVRSKSNAWYLWDLQRNCIWVGCIWCLDMILKQLHLVSLFLDFFLCLLYLHLNTATLSIQIVFVIHSLSFVVMCISSSFSVCCEQPSHLGPPLGEIWACIVTTDYHYSADIPASDKKRSMVKEELTWIWTSSGLLADCSIKRFRELVQKATSPASILSCSLSKSIWSAIVVPVCISIQWQMLNIGCGNEQACLSWSFIYVQNLRIPQGSESSKKLNFIRPRTEFPLLCQEKGENNGVKMIHVL